MSDNKYVVSHKNLQDVADAIRERGGTQEQLTFPDEFVEAIENIGDNIPEYEGEYQVEPQLETDQTLETSGKKMVENLTVKGMPVRIVHAQDGGLVYYIGE